MVKKKSFKTERQINADLALKHRLYVSQQGFCLSETLQDIRSGYDKNSKIVLHYQNDIPVGVAVYQPYSYVNIQIFVRKSMRRQGIGQKLMLALNAPANSIAGLGNIVDSKRFFSKQKNVVLDR